MVERVELAVVGAGPAGLEAALTAAEAGVSVWLIDNYPRPGGQYFKQLPGAFRGNGSSLPQAEAQALFQRLVEAPNIRLLTDTLVWGVFPEPRSDGWQLALHGPTAPHRLQAETLLLATGAYDRPIPFPGWTLPGVITAGAAQTLLKNQRLLPGRRILLSGTGPLQIAVAAQLIQAGADVVAVLEGAAVKWQQNIRQIGAWWGQWGRLGEGWAYWRTLRRAGVPLRFGWSVIEAHGAETVEEVVIARLDADWQPIPGSEQTFSVDTLVIGYGFIPSTQLGRLLGCTHVFRPEQGGYVPCRDDKLQTSCPGVYAAGDGAGIGGGELARLEGRIAGVAVAERLNRLDKNAAQAAITRLQPALVRERRFAAMLGQLFTPGPGLYRLATDDTLICRCEEIRLADIREAVQNGAQKANAVKGITRAGMGNCQGRICAELVARVIAAEGGYPGEYIRRLEAAGIFTARSPLQPLPLEVLAEATTVTNTNS